MYTPAVIAALAAALVSANPEINPAQAKSPQDLQSHGHQHGECKPQTEYVYVNKKPCRRSRYFCPPLPPCQQCPKEFGEFFVLQDHLPFYRADCACKAKGGKLAQVSSANFNNAVNAVFSCVGPNRYAWVESWNGDNYNHACLGLYTGSQPGGGSIAVPLSCESHVPVLCQKVHKECHNNECWEYVWEWESSSEIDDCDRCHPHDRQCHHWCRPKSDLNNDQNGKNQKSTPKMYKQRI